MKKSIAVLVAIFIPISASAAILNPYVVDEKPQVLFGDSLPVSTYYGLENYTQDYQNGYLHITFTYTHSQCCIASYPPKLYITDIDPRSTISPVLVKYNEIIYLLSFIHFNHIAGLYSYDIRFDANGYTLTVNGPGETTLSYE